MNTYRRFGFLLLLAQISAFPGSLQSAPLTTAFTYQGRLIAGGAPANGLFDLRLTLFDLDEGGNVVGMPLTNANVAVANGLFTTTLDFGAGIFTGNTFWLETAVRPTEFMMDFSPLLPRQPLTAAPYALFAPNAGSANNLPWSGLTEVPAGFADNVDNDTTYSAGDGLTLDGVAFEVNFYGSGISNTVSRSDHRHDASQIDSGMLDDARLSANIARLNAPQTFTGLVTLDASTSEPFAVGRADKVTNLNADLVDGMDSSAFWQLGGNGQTTPGTDYVGTSDNQALEFKVNNQRALRIEPAASPNIIGGYPGNFAQAGSAGVTISGGGFAGLTNEVANNFGVIAGGLGNLVQGQYSTIGGGLHHRILTGAEFSTIGSGRDNTVESDKTTIGGGVENQVQTGASASTIGGGEGNQVQTGAYSSTIGGGNNNMVSSNSFYATIGGGTGNFVDGQNSTVGGGSHNAILAGVFSGIGGGSDNTIGSDTLYSTIGGGSGNRVVSDAIFTTIGGGGTNLTGAGTHACTISGGLLNEIEDGTEAATIVGGYEAKAALYGQVAHASGAFANKGDAQASTYVLRREAATPLTLLELFLDGQSQRLTLPEDSTWAFDILAVARSNAGGSAGFQIQGVIENTGGTTTLVGTPTVTAKYGEASWSAAVNANNNTLSLLLTNTGMIYPMRCVASVRTVELSY